MSARRHPLLPAAVRAAKWVEVRERQLRRHSSFWPDLSDGGKDSRVWRKNSVLVKLCKERGVAMRIGRITGRFRTAYYRGDTPLGMVSRPSSSPASHGRGLPRIVFDEVLQRASAWRYRLLVRLMEKGMDYPLHLSVTEAGDGEDAFEIRHRDRGAACRGGGRPSLPLRGSGRTT